MTLSSSLIDYSVPFPKNSSFKDNQSVEWNENKDDQELHLTIHAYGNLHLKIPTEIYFKVNLFKSFLKNLLWIKFKFHIRGCKKKGACYSNSKAFPKIRWAQLQQSLYSSFRDFETTDKQTDLIFFGLGVWISQKTKFKEDLKNVWLNFINLVTDLMIVLKIYY